MTPESVEKPTQLTESDRVLLQRAADGMKEAKAVYVFVSNHLAPIYEISSADTVDAATGVIVRPPTPEQP